MTVTNGISQLTISDQLTSELGGSRTKLLQPYNSWIEDKSTDGGQIVDCWVADNEIHWEIEDYKMSARWRLEG